MTSNATPKYMEPVCPGCGDNHVNRKYGREGIDHHSNPPTIQCYNCGLVYPLTPENGREINTLMPPGPS